jgi:hypothetical protein
MQPGVPGAGHAQLAAATCRQVCWREFRSLQSPPPVAGHHLVRSRRLGPNCTGNHDATGNPDRAASLTRYRRIAARQYRALLLFTRSRYARAAVPRSHTWTKRLPDGQLSVIACGCAPVRGSNYTQSSVYPILAGWGPSVTSSHRVGSRTLFRRGPGTSGERSARDGRALTTHSARPDRHELIFA